MHHRFRKAWGAPHLHQTQGQILADALLRAVSRGHDNELFVLLVNLLETPDHLEPLLRAARVAVSRHHRVMVVCPWPEVATQTKGKPGTSVPGVVVQTPGADAPGSLAHDRWRQAFQEVRRSFARWGIVVVPSRGQDPSKLILERFDRLRMQGRTDEW